MQNKYFLDYYATTLKNTQLKLRIITEHHQKGLVHKDELLLTRKANALAQIGFYQAWAEYINTLNALEVLLGRYPASILELKESVVLPKLKDIPVGVPSDILWRRPDLQAAYARLLAAGYTAEGVKKNLFPSIRLTSSYGLSSNRLNGLLENGVNFFSIGINLLQPIFNAGQLKADRKRAEYLAKIHIFEYENLLLKVFSEVEALLSQIAFLKNASVKWNELATQAKINYQLSEQSYKAGLINQLDLLQAKQEVLEADRDLFKINILYLKNRLDLYLSLGGGFQ